MALEGIQLGQYRLLRLLGSGGMGEVYLAEDARIGQQVAIKVSRMEATPYPDSSAGQDTLRLFQREAKAVAKLDHPRILPLFSYGEERVNGMTLIYIVMPYRREGSFVDWLQQRSNKHELLSVQDVAYFISQAADALQYAHENQIVHQDVKPSNFLIRANKEHPRLPDLLLADFGIAKLSTSTSSVSHAIRGTPTYMAPEQWSGEPVYATDQYALAVLAYELLAGRPPFVGRQEQVMYQHFSVPPQPPSAFNPQLSKDVDAVILKALAKQAVDRFPSISAFATALREATQYLDASTVVKEPYTPSSSELRATLAISRAEAQAGSNRILTLPGGRRVSVPVPAGAYNGQVLRLPGIAEPGSGDGAVGTLILTLYVQDTEAGIPPAPGINSDQTVPASNPNIGDATTLSSNRAGTPPPPSSFTPTPPPQITPLPQMAAYQPQQVGGYQPQTAARREGISTGTAILLVGLALLLLVGGLGFFYLYSSGHSSPNTSNTGTPPANGGGTGNADATATTLANNINATATASANDANATATAHAATVNASTPSVGTTPTSSYVQLKSSYSGTASGPTNGAITFTLQSEDQQGNVQMLTTFENLSNQNTDSYTCQGAVTQDRHLNLQCTSASNASYMLTVQGYVFADGHMEGTETATNTNDPNYRHEYSWKAY